jgi:hypothetical protein
VQTHSTEEYPEIHPGSILGKEESRHDGKNQGEECENALNSTAKPLSYTSFEWRNDPCYFCALAVER